MTPDEIKALVRTIPDFPSPGIQFRDITTLLSHGEAFAASVKWLAGRARDAGAEAVVGLEARGFIFGAAAAAALGVGFIPIRKSGRLPMETIGVDYALEYGSDRLELDPGAVSAGQRIIVIDDLLATGGTAGAAIDLLRLAGATVEHALFAADLPDLGGSAALARKGVAVAALMAFAGD